MGWKGESRRHSLSRKGIKTASGKIKAKGRTNKTDHVKKIIPQGYHFVNRQELINQSNKGYYRTKNGKVINDLSVSELSPLYEQFGDTQLTPEEIMSLDPETYLSINQVTGRRGKIEGSRLKLKHIIIPQTDPLLLQIEVGVLVELADGHTTDWRRAEEIARDHLEDHDRYYFKLLEAFPDEHPELLTKLRKNQAHGIPKTKTVGSKRYRYHSAYLFRVWADTVKEHLEKRGFKVKETIANNGVIVLYKYGG